MIPALEARPILYEDLHYHWQVFLDLNETRSAGFAGPESITYHEINAYMEAHEITEPSERQRLIQRVRFIDREFLKAIK